MDITIYQIENDIKKFLEQFNNTESCESYETEYDKNYGVVISFYNFLFDKYCNNVLIKQIEEKQKEIEVLKEKMIESKSKFLKQLK